MPKGTTVAVQTTKSRDSVQSASFVFYRKLRGRSRLSTIYTDSYIQFFEKKK